MWSLNLFSCILFVSFGIWCSQAVEPPEVHIISEKDAVEPRSRFLDGLHREGKRQKEQSPNVHIENIYIPQQIQKGDETIEGYPIYPVYSYPLKKAETVRKASKQSKPKPATTGSQPSDTTQHKDPQQPTVIYNQNYPPHGNGYISIPYSALRSPQQTHLTSGQSPPGYPYYVVINSPHSVKPHQDRPTKIIANTIPGIKDKDEKPEVGEEDYVVEPIVSKPKKKSYNASQLQKPRPQLRLSKFEDNLGLSLAKYLLGHPLYSINDMERSSQTDNEMLANANDDEEEEEDDDDDDDDDESTDAEDANGKYSGNIDMISATEDKDYDDFSKIQNFIKRRQQLTKGNKLPVDFVWDQLLPNNKLDDRVALVFLRQTKRGRKLVFPEN